MTTAVEKHDARLNCIRKMTERSQERVELLTRARLVLTRLQLYVILNVERDFMRLLDVALHDDDALTQAVAVDLSLDDALNETLMSTLKDEATLH